MGLAWVKARDVTYTSQNTKDSPIREIIFSQVACCATAHVPYVLEKGKALRTLLQIMQMYLNDACQSQESVTISFPGEWADFVRQQILWA